MNAELGNEHTLGLGEVDELERRIRMDREEQATCALHCATNADAIRPSTRRREHRAEWVDLELLGRPFAEEIDVAKEGECRCAVEVDEPLDLARDLLLERAEKLDARDHVVFNEVFA